MSISCSLLFTLLLGPPAAPADYSGALARVTQLNDRINSGEAVEDELRQALVELTQFAPLLAEDPEGLVLRSRAQFLLARAALSNGDEETAKWIVDEAIRSVLGGELPLEGFSSSLVQLVSQRRAALEESGSGSIAVQCTRPCRVFVNEHATEEVIEDLPLGVYRIWIDSEDHSDAPSVLTEIVQVEERGEIVRVIYAPDVVEDVEPVAPLPSDPPRRLMPRGAEAAMVAIGAGLATSGALLMAFGPSQGESIGGGVMLALGGAALVAGSVTIGVDETRLRKQRGHQAMLVWTIRF
jgi:hypothetical protein